MSESSAALKWAIIISMALLAGLCIAWEIWLAPVREGAWMLSLKALPILLALPGMVAERIRTFQWWSMLTMIYLAEGVVRAMSESGLVVLLGWTEAALATVIFLMVLVYCKRVRAPAQPAS
ncbi:MAG: DUF2069 domain-containing protein [Burkholderiaceae bacterium]